MNGRLGSAGFVALAVGAMSAITAMGAMSAMTGCSSDDTSAAGSGGASTQAGTPGPSGSGGASGGQGQGGGGLTGQCPTEGQGAPPPLKATEIVSGLAQPIWVGSAPGDPATRLFVVEQNGLVRIVDSGSLIGDAFLDVTGLTAANGEQGLLGLAFHPGYAQNGRLFINYTDSNGNTVVAEYKRSAADPNKADPTATKQLLEIDQPYANHNGGNIVFGPDGYLYIGMGDGGSGNDPNGNGQNIGVKLAKMLRVDVDNYPTPPPGNLPGGDPDVWDYGLRNPWRWSFDRCTGDLYIGDVGQDHFEEIDFEPKGQGNKNYGWNITEGSHCRYDPSIDHCSFPQEASCDTSSEVLPLVEYQHDLFGSCDEAVTGGYVYRGTAIPSLVGTYIYADYVHGSVWSLRNHGGTVSDQTELTSELNPDGVSISSFGEDSAGEVYFLDHQGGRVLKIEAQ